MAAAASRCSHRALIKPTITGSTLSSRRRTSCRTTRRSGPIRYSSPGFGRRSGRGRGRREVPGRRRGVDHRRQVLQGCGQHRRPCRQAVGPRRSSARGRHIRRRDRIRLAAGQFSPPRSQGRPNTTYVASYHARRDGMRSLDYFASSSVSSPPLCTRCRPAWTDRTAFMPTARVRFPTSTFRAANYWVDVVFAPEPATGTAAAAAVNRTTVPARSQTQVPEVGMARRRRRCRGLGPDQARHPQRLKQRSGHYARGSIAAWQGYAPPRCRAEIRAKQQRWRSPGAGSRRACGAPDGISSRTRSPIWLCARARNVRNVTRAHDSIRVQMVDDGVRHFSRKVALKDGDEEEVNFTGDSDDVRELVDGSDRGSDGRSR